MNKQDVAFDQLVSDLSTSVNGKNTNNGWLQLNCPMCANKDQRQKKGGFKFEPDQIGYSCFRGSCDANTVYKLGEPIPRKFKELMSELGIKIPIELLASGRKRKTWKEEILDERFEKNVYKTLSFGSDVTDEIPDGWIEYLAERRFIYYELDVRYAYKGDYKGSLIIPHYFFDKLIGWTYITKDGKYITANGSSESMLFFPERIPPKRPIIVEGLPDAWCFPDTVATERSKVTEKQAYHLRNTSPIVLPDRTGSRLYESAKTYGWDVCVPMWKEKDLNEAVINKGLLSVAHIIHNNVMKPSAKTDILYKRWTYNA